MPINLDALGAVDAGSPSPQQARGINVQALQAIEPARPQTPQPKKLADPYDIAGQYSPEAIQAFVQPSWDAIAGMVRGAGSIGSTLLRPFESKQANEKRRADMNAGLVSLGADPTSPVFKLGQFGGEVAGTAGMGGVLGKTAKALNASPELIAAIESGGLSGGGNMGTRTLGGMITGGATSGLVNPEHTVSGAVVGGAIPGLVKSGEWLGNVASEKAKALARALMKSALKPTYEQYKSGEAETAIDTMLQYGLSPSQKGVDKIRSMLDEKNAQIADLIANNGAKINKADVIRRVEGTKDAFTKQVDPLADIDAINGVTDRFSAHPLINGDEIPIQLAQELKQGTYRAIDKKYGQMGGAETEAQKALARGLKEEISKASPSVAGLNAEESKLIAAMNVAQRRAYMEGNKNPMGLAALATDPKSWTAFMADRSAALKALAANAANKASGINTMGPSFVELLKSPAVRTGIELTSYP